MSLQELAQYYGVKLYFPSALSKDYKPLHSWPCFAGAGVVSPASHWSFQLIRWRRFRRTAEGLKAAAAHADVTNDEMTDEQILEALQARRY